MVQQARLLSAAVSNRGGLEKETLHSILTNLERRSETRLRVLDKNRKLLADSSSPELDNEISDNNEVSYDEVSKRISNPLYEFASFPVRFYRDLFLPPVKSIDNPNFYSSEKPFNGSEIRAALDGRYGAVTRIIRREKSVRLYCAIPIRDKGEVIGVILASQSTYRILKDLYEIRLNIFKIFLASVFAAILLSFFLSSTISRPLTKLKKQAEALIDHRGRLSKNFVPTKRRDEIGDLSRSLEELTTRLKQHILFIQSFSIDISHEFKNPMASIKAATEILYETNKLNEKKKFFNMIQRDIIRMEALLGGVREITQIDAGLTEEKHEFIDVSNLMAEIVEGYRFKNFPVNMVAKGTKVIVYASPERLVQVFTNIIDNALSFGGGKPIVEISISTGSKNAKISIRDYGSGIPEEHIDRIFERFFSFRPDNKSNKHTGLGLSIAKTIIEGYGGAVHAGNNEKEGAVFRIELPLARREIKTNLKIS